MSEVKNDMVAAAENKQALISALQNDFATTVNSIYINSLDRDVGFREITVKEQKTLSRIMIDNDSKNRKDVVYDAQCALINQACLEKGTFDIYDLTEFDRLKLLIAIYQTNMFKNDVRFTCDECGTDNIFKLDFDVVVKKLDDVKLTEKEFKYENKLWDYTFVLRYPSVKRVLEFYKSYVKKYRGVRKQEAKSLDNMSNMDYINMFIKSVVAVNKQTEASRTIEFDTFAAGDVEDILAIFPQDVLYSNDGVLKYIVNEYIKVINDAFEVHRCSNCGAEYKNDVNSAQSFL